MKVLFDVNVPRPLRRHLPGHQVATSQERDWAELRNGDLLAAVEADFDVLLTADQNLKYQQNMAGRKIAIIVLPTNYMPDVLELAPKIRAALDRIKPGDYVEIPARN